MQFYLRGPEIFRRCLIFIVPRIITKNMNLLFPRVCTLYFLEKSELYARSHRGRQIN